MQDRNIALLEMLQRCLLHLSAYFKTRPVFSSGVHLAFTGALSAATVADNQIPLIV
ncbi:hypothetical protein B0H19DRAFT_1125484 [Mycena capillaripes]|nr:hypothetical protein B0H19DRAFT_1125484 [Mycena capillaripes]